MAFSDDADKANAGLDSAEGSVNAAGSAEIGAASADVHAAGSVVDNAGEVAAAATAKAQDVVDVGADAVGVAVDAVSTAVGAVVDAVSVLGSFIPASLTCITPPNVGFVPFDFNPETITMSRTSTTGGVSRPQRPDATALAGGARTSGTSGTYTRQVKASQIKLSDIIMEGPFTKLRCDTLLTWMNPSTGLFAQFAAAGGNFSTLPAPLTFVWGPPMIGFMYDVTIASCSVTYERFTPAGIPTRAKISLTMNEVPSKLSSLPTNPTSGGIPGRRGHTVAHGESLQSIATEKYGTPGLWRRIAEVNRIQDPTRVRPGTTIYLPNPDELKASRS